MNEMELLEKIAGGDIEAFNQFYEKTHNRVYFLAKKYLRDEQDVLETVQDVFVAVYRDAGKINNLEAWKSWLGQITINLSISKATRKRQPESTPLDDEEFLIQLPSDAFFDPAKSMDEEETKRLIAEMIDVLPAAQRESVILYYFEEMKVEEIAKTMQVSAGTVKSRLNYARNSIRKSVEELEHKGIKLYSLSPILLLAGVEQLAKQTTMTQAQAQLALTGASAAITKGTAVSAAEDMKTTAKENHVSTSEGVRGGKKTAFGAAAAKKSGTAVKVLAGVVAAALIGGGIAAYRHLHAKSAPAAQKTTVSEPDRSALEAEALKSIPYYGDRSICKMTAAQAHAYAQLILNEIADKQIDQKQDCETYDSGVQQVARNYAYLCDFNHDGMPLLVLFDDTYLLDAFTLYGFDGEKAHMVLDCNSKVCRETFTLGLYQGQTVLEDYGSTGADTGEQTVYKISNGDAAFYFDLNCYLPTFTDDGYVHYCITHKDMTNEMGVIGQETGGDYPQLDISGKCGFYQQIKAICTDRDMVKYLNQYAEAAGWKGERASTGKKETLPSKNQEMLKLFNQGDDSDEMVIDAGLLNLDDDSENELYLVKSNYGNGEGALEYYIYDWSDGQLNERELMPAEESDTIAACEAAGNTERAIFHNSNNGKYYIGFDGSASGMRSALVMNYNETKLYDASASGCWIDNKSVSQSSYKNGISDYHKIRTLYNDDYNSIALTLTQRALEQNTALAK